MTRTAQPTQAPVTVDALVKAYDDAKGAAKAALRREATEAMADAIRDEDFVLAGVYAKATALMVTAAPEKAVVDYANLIKERAATLMEAALLIMAGQVKPEGTPEDFKIEPFTVKDLDPDLRAQVFDSARKIAAQKIVTGTKSARKEGGVFGHIVDATATLGQGFHTVTKISTTKSDTYGDDLPSSGAVRAHFDSKTWSNRTEAKNVTFVSKGTRVDGMNTDAQADGVFVA